MFSCWQNWQFGKLNSSVAELTRHEGEGKNECMILMIGNMDRAEKPFITQPVALEKMSITTGLKSCIPEMKTQQQQKSHATLKNRVRSTDL